VYHLFPKSLPGGYIGVDVFFVISGFLITTLLVGEHRQTGRISLKKFWLRRARRLLPALLATILTVSSIVFFVRGDIMVGIGQQIFGASTFSSNWIEVINGTNYFTNNATHLFMNFWSLAVEEQFYLLWPFVIVLLVEKIKKPHFGIIVTSLLALGSAGFMAYLFSKGASTTRVYYGTDTHVFGLMIGAFLAFWSHSQTAGQPARRFSQHFWKLRRTPVTTQTISVLALAGLIALLCTLSDQSPLAYTGGLFGASVLTAIVLVSTISMPGLLQKLFTAKSLEWIGTRSYGIYLWHWPLLVLLRFMVPSTIAGWVIPSSLLVLTFGIAGLSYRFVEMPIRQQGFRATFSRVAKRRRASVDIVTTRLHARPRFVVFVGSLAIILTATAVIDAPSKTAAQLNIEAGQKAIQQQANQPQSKPVIIQPPVPAVPSQTAPPLKVAPTDGTTITAVGDSVMLASALYLQEKFPGILINAEISRSLTRGGLETIDTLNASGQLRGTVIVALGTNGYYGTGKLDELIERLQGHNIILVTAHADREWTSPNNDNVHAAAQKNSNVSVAEWDQVISPHPDFLSSDGIHPNKDGNAIYADCIIQAMKKFE